MSVISSRPVLTPALIPRADLSATVLLVMLQNMGKCYCAPWICCRIWVSASVVLDMWPSKVSATLILDIWLNMGKC
jgi:hypothetical protein